MPLRLTFTLDKYHLVHRYGSAGGLIVRKGKGSVEKRNIVKPGIPQFAGIPNVYMGVYNTKIKHVSSYS
jgi:hypothetical protein